MSIVIKAENISKQYRLGLVGTGTVKDDFKRWWHTMRGKEDPFLKIGEANDRSIKGESDYVWSLRDINFEINQGDSVGIIGRNGAGKSTLLKILSQVTQPTTGKIYTKGRIASLLEVGTGFHPEMTGRENIFLNGAILGMRKHEIQRKLDEIIAFSGVERYIDTPVKRYSSGMYVRLAFAVAAHLESEILIVDEVLAVGDAEFQKKCLGKMNDVSKGEGRTVLFVSHNMAAVKSLCNRGVLLENGDIKIISGVREVVDYYKRDWNSNSDGSIKIDNPNLIFIGISNIKTELSVNDSLNLIFNFKSLDFKSKNFFLDVGIYNSSGEMVIHSKTRNFRNPFEINQNSEFSIQYCVENPNLAPDNYYLTLFVYDTNDDNILLWIEEIPLCIVNPINKYLMDELYNKLEDVRSVTYPYSKFSKYD